MSGRDTVRARDVQRLRHDHIQRLERLHLVHPRGARVAHDGVPGHGLRRQSLEVTQDVANLQLLPGSCSHDGLNDCISSFGCGNREKETPRGSRGDVNPSSHVLAIPVQGWCPRRARTRPRDAERIVTEAWRVWPTTLQILVASGPPSFARPDERTSAPRALTRYPAVARDE